MQVTGDGYHLDAVVNFHRNEADMTFVTWLFNPWDYGDAALVFAAVVAVTSGVATPFRARLGGGVACVNVAAIVTITYVVGAIVTAGFGPLALPGAVMLFIPAVIIAAVAMWATARLLRTASPST